MEDINQEPKLLLGINFSHNLGLMNPLYSNLAAASQISLKYTLIFLLPYFIFNLLFLPWTKQDDFSSLK